MGRKRTLGARRRKTHFKQIPVAAIKAVIEARAQTATRKRRVAPRAGKSASNVAPATAPAKSATRQAKVDKRRICPLCGMRLTWVETRRWRAVPYDYYRECTSGCGVSVFASRRRTQTMG